jgi:hypothetical protein
MKTSELLRVCGGVFDPSVKNCKAAFKGGQITVADIKQFQANRSYRGNTAASQACFAKAAWGGFGFTEQQVKDTFGYKD